MNKKSANSVVVSGIIGNCGSLQAFLGFAPARILCAISFADILNEDSGEGYQRPHNRLHSVDFRRYISRPNTSTIPLIFNLRNEFSSSWKLHKFPESIASLEILSNAQCMSRVDCQHRLGELQESDIPLAFMAFIGLDLRAEMAMFSVINSKAKGLSSSLTDFHETKLLDDVRTEAPHLYLARKLNEDPSSPWYKMIRYGGESTSGSKRRTSLRMMQKSIQRLLKQVDKIAKQPIDDVYQLLTNYWEAVRETFPDDWRDHHHSLITKGIGLFSLMLLLTEMVKQSKTVLLTIDNIKIQLNPIVDKVDWHSQGTFADAGGHKGAQQVFEKLKQIVDL